MEQAVIVNAVRTPVGSYGKTLCAVSAVDLGVTALKEALQRTGIEPATSG